MTKLALVIIALFLTIHSVEAQLSCGLNIDLNSWIEEGDTSQGDWVVSTFGNSVEQKVNAQATFFVSPEDYFNVLIQGKIKVDTTWDDDMIGFVFGYQDPSSGGALLPSSVYINSYFFDWKQQTQTYAGALSNEGFALYHVDGNVDFIPVGGFVPEFWLRGGVGSSVSTVLDTNYGNNGWNDYQEYDFQLQYTANQIIVWIDGDEVINVTGCFEPGRFGFYNNSQAEVIYSDFSYKYIYDAEVITPDICLNDTASFQIVASDSCTYANYFPAGTTFSWDFGDGATATGLNAVHQYTAPGTYAVQVIMTDTSLCSDTTILTINVNDFPTPDAPLDVIACQNYVLPSLSVGGYFTSTGGIGPISVGTNITTTQVIYVHAGIGSCTVENSFTVTINPDLAISLGNDLQVCEEDVSLTPGTGFTSYLWQDGSSGSSYLASSYGQYNVTVTDSNGCVGYSEIELIENCPYVIWIPNAFTPNGDQINDNFNVAHQNLISLHVDIINRWGQVIYAWDDLNGYWNGMNASGTPVPDGVYLYLIKYSYANTSGVVTKSKTGHLTLLR